jgi:hypothetical protein
MQGDSMGAITQREAPHLGIFWVVQTTDGEERVLTAGCPLDRAEPYGDCLTYGPGHCDIWARWRRDRTVDPALRAVVRSYEYEDWPRGRHHLRPVARSVHPVCRPQLLIPAMIARIATQFHLPAERTESTSDLHYQSKETPNVLAVRRGQP